MQIHIPQKRYFERRFSPNIPVITKYDIDLLFAFGLLGFSSALLFIIIQFLVPFSDNVVDHYFSLFFTAHTTAHLIETAKICSFFGTGTFLIPAYLVIIIFLSNNNHPASVYLVLSAALSATILGWLLKIVFHRSRPLNHLVSGAGGYSFPSGHALGGFIFTGIVLYAIWKTSHHLYVKWSATIFIFIFGLAIGLSRICLHVHFATDVLGSLMIAISWNCLLYIIFRLYYMSF